MSINTLLSPKHCKIRQLSISSLNMDGMDLTDYVSNYFPHLFWGDVVSVGSGSSRLPARQVAKLQFKIMFTQIRRRCAHAFSFSNNCSAFRGGAPFWDCRLRSLSPRSESEMVLYQSFPVGRTRRRLEATLF